MSEMDFHGAQAQLQRHTEPLVFPIVVYALYLSSLFFLFPWLIGLIMAHVKAGAPGVDPISLSHYRYQIRTFWLSLAPSIVGGLLLIVYIGWLIIIPVAIWGLVRDVKGLLYAIERKPIPNPTTWLW